MFSRVPGAAAALLLLLVPLAAAAQEWTVVEDDHWCREGKGNASWCEVREITLPARGEIEVEGGKNGGIQVKGWDKNEIELRVKVRVWDLSSDEAADFAADIEIETDGRIEAEGPSRGPGNWSVSFQLMVPESSDLVLDTYNGGISIVDVSGEIEFGAKNGGISLVGLGGEVYGRTANGGVDIVLGGEKWAGEGMDVETKNGGISIDIPTEYSARLVTGTRNGRVRSEIPLTFHDSRDRRVRATLGDGGALLRIVTTNGGIDINET